MEKIRPPINNTKQAKRTRETVQKRLDLRLRTHLDIIEVNILIKSDVSEDIKMGIGTEFGVKAVEHKE